MESKTITDGPGLTITCGRCGARSHMTAAMQKSQVIKKWVREQTEVDICDRAYTCDACGRLNIATWEARFSIYERHDTETRVQLEQPNNRGSVKWYPILGQEKHFPDVPEHIAEAATEASLCLSVQAYRAACSLARAVVEATAKDKGCDKNSAGKKVMLEGMIDEMFTKGLVREVIKAAAHEIRHLGNDMAHGDFAESITSEEANETINLMELVLQEVYQSVALIARRKFAREAKLAED